MDKLPEGNFYAVIFSSIKSEDREGYEEMDQITMKLAFEQPGFLGYESATDGKKGILISYWKDMASINSWKNNATHMIAKGMAHKWYDRYLTQICLVERSRLFEK